MPFEADYRATGTALALPDGARLLRASNGARAVTVKVLASENATAIDVQRLRNEHELGKRLACDGVLRSLELGTWNGCPALLFEGFDAVPLTDLIGEPMTAARFLPLAEKIVRALADLHLAGIVHRDVKPQNVLIAKGGEGDVKLIGLGIASLLPTERASLEGKTRVEGALAFMSPEQTGRMNRPVDHRSDLYSLGVTFYQMLTGQLPFTASDPLEWIHCHVARMPPPLTTLTPAIPETLSAIVMKLLAKVADQRYQSARGLCRDLERCRQHLVAKGRIDPFPLGSDDVPEQFQIPQSLYGRERETQALVSAFENVRRTGAPELLLVAGGAGTGKSRLVHEIEEPVVLARGFFIAGKFDRFKRDIPYSTFVQAFREVVLEVLSASADGIAAWRQQLHDALGPNGQLIVDVIPPIELVIGKQPAVVDLPPTEAQNRFRIVFRQFIGVFAQEEHPLTLFLDDLQWADAASLALLQDLMTRPESRHLFVIGAYRDNEVSLSHPVSLTVDAIQRAGTRVSHISLGPLSVEHVGALVSDALRCHADAAKPLAELVHAKTFGNPFFAVQFLSALREERLIELFVEAGAWHWDVAKIRAKSFTDNVVDLMVGKLRRLPRPTQDVLEHLACIGNSAELRTLATVYGRSEEDTRGDLREAVLGGHVLLAGSTYRFAHDRIQEATYSLIPEASRAEAHLRIGRLLVARRAAQDALEVDDVFEIVNQLNRAVELIDDPAEQASLSALNHRAGRKAKAAVAYESARSYLARAADLLAADAWEAHYEETFALYLELSECEYLVGHFDRADELFSLLLRNARGNPDRAEVYILRITLYQLAGRPADGLMVMVDAVKSMGVSFPEDPDALVAALEAEQREVAVNLRGRRIRDLARAPLATDPEVRALIRLLVAAMPCAHIGRPQVFPLIVVRGLNLVLRYGNTRDACFAYSAYGTLLVGMFGDIPSAFEYAEMSIRLNEKFDDARFKGTILYLYAHFIHGWGRPFATLRPILDRILPAFLEVGEFVFASYHGSLSIWASLERGDPLDETLQIARTFGSFANETHNRMLVAFIAQQEQFVRCLKGLTRAPTSLDDEHFDEVTMLETARELEIFTGIAYFYISKQIVCFWHEHYDEALAHATSAGPLLGTLMATPIEATHHFYLALTLVAVLGNASDDDARKSELRQQLDAECAKLAHWAKHCPENYQNRHDLVSAEVARIERRDQDAMRLYEDAIRSAHEQGFVQNEALSYELASRFYRARGFDRIAETYLREARACYVRLGADGKVTQLDGKLPREPDAAALSPSTTFTARTEQLDLFSVVKALQLISSAIVLDDLLRTLLKIVLEQGGAQRATLLLAGDDARLSVEAEAVATEAGVTISREPRPPTPGTLPQEILDYVGRTKERVLLDDASGRGRFSGDPYIKRTSPRSVLCLPIIRQTELVGLLYLENNLLTRAFTPDRLSVLELLSAQAAISLENATLYADLGRENAERRTAERAILGATEALRQSEERFRLLVDGVKDGAIFMLDSSGSVASWNAGAERLFGHDAGEVIGQPCACFYPPEEVARGGPERALALAGRSGSSEQDGWRLRRDGTRFYAAMVLTALRDEGGELRSYSALVRDQTQRLRLEDQVRQAQKMEAVGRLAGGVAHDFNNLLAAIYGFVYHGLKRLAPDSPVRTDLQEIQEAARRAGELTTQLLSFARKQRVELRVFDLNALVLSMDRLLRRVLGDDIDLVTLASPELGSVEADPGQIEQVILNLAVNARDAMPGGGVMTIETANVELSDDHVSGHADVTPGPFAMLALSDSGTGMPAEVVQHVFEPFFTTKGPGEGTGLGLATSYGIIKQAGGHIWVYSELGRGTTFKIYLPRSSRSTTESRLPPAPSPASKGETLLLVEDHVMLRTVSTRSLEAAGYHVLSAQDGDDAIRMAAAHEGTIDLLLTDVVMPKMSGHELAQRLVTLRPGLKVLYVSGYTENALIRTGEPGQGSQFLAKPFTPDELARKVRAVLDG